jgi:2-oxoglutarate dehydrogenase E2 component (dihydrolipoamide succinyltransferase)
MTIKVTVPELGESVFEATVGEWHKQEGDPVAIGDVLVELETDKVDVEVGAESAGVLVSIERQTGEDVQIGDVLANIEPDGAAPAAEDTASQPDEAEPTEGSEPEKPETAETQPKEKVQATPVAQRLAEEKGVDLTKIAGSGTNGRITRQDVEGYLKEREETQLDDESPGKEKDMAPAPKKPESVTTSDRQEERIRLSRRRRTIARRLVEAQQTAAMLTTFNDVDMSAVITLRKRRGEAFLERHGVKLGFMSFFVKGVIGALKAFPRLNAEIDDEEMVLKHYFDIGIAVGAEDGLVVPVVRDADRKSFAEIEREIRDLAQKAKDGSLTLEDLRGGTFTITNGGVFGSLLSTPILNPPQVGILGLHRIEDRPIAVEGEVAIRPMMYLALSYDHRIVDGREAVQFLVQVKELIEDPEMLLLEG